MKLSTNFLILLTALLLFNHCSEKRVESGAVVVFSDYPIRPVPFTDVTLQDEFWSKKIKTNHEVTIPIAVQKSEESGRIDNFKVAAGLQEGSFCSIYPFDDSDVFKIIEAASYSIQTFPDPAMEIMIDSLIGFMAAAQEPDGYLYTNRTIGKPVHEWAGSKRWEFVHDLSHELYNLGHMYEAAVAHYQATGKRTLLDVAIKSANLVCKEFGPNGIENYPGHQEIEIGLIKLFRITGELQYLDMAKFFLDARGKEGVGNPKTYDQSHIPVVDQREAVGHSVRATYMWSAMADIAAITGDDRYMTAIKSIWEDVVGGKLYINGGIGATGDHEGFSVPYDLPNMSAYCETCAGVGNAIWNHRMFLMTGDSKYIDVLERTMYNNIIDGVSLTGDRFFYPNPLESNGQHQRSEWFGCACCPPNVARFLPSMPGYIYAQKEEKIYVNLYVSSETAFDIGNNSIILTQESGFPWDGNVTVNVELADTVEAAILFRIPGYVRNKPVPSELYSYVDVVDEKTEFLLNGQLIENPVNELGYVVVNRTWNTGDEVSIRFPFRVRMVKAREEVTEDKDKIAIERGPLLYCAEWPDSETGTVLNMVLDPNSTFSENQSDDLGGIIALNGQADFAQKAMNGKIELGSRKPIRLIPYHLWNNRGPGQMRIWLPTNVRSTLPSAAPTIAYRSTVTSSGDLKSTGSIVDQFLPKTSGDRTVPYLHWWPNKDTTEWVQFDFERVKTVRNVNVYWYDDGPDGGCRIPKDWKVMFLDKNGSWSDVSAAVYPNRKDVQNEVSFDPVTTKGLRILVTLPEEFASGIHEVEIN